MVAESDAAGATVPLVSIQHGVPTSRKYSWRGDARFQPSEVETLGFTPIEVLDAPKLNDNDHLLSEARIEITIENGRKLSISNGVDAGFVLEPTRGLAA
ncbi:MAG: IS66 family insertion sequence element accessory protein TnpB [Rhodobacteraceae bacterium]|nr:IS66 family insertion sequence element accessory protein TnpB [Paracoccaceae bacterium]